MQVYKGFIISTIVDQRRRNGYKKVYKGFIISTIVDRSCQSRAGQSIRAL